MRVWPHFHLGVGTTPHGHHVARFPQLAGVGDCLENTPCRPRQYKIFIASLTSTVLMWPLPGRLLHLSKHEPTDPDRSKYTRQVRNEPGGHGMAGLANTHGAKINRDNIKGGLRRADHDRGHSSDE